MIVAVVDAIPFCVKVLADGQSKLVTGDLVAAEAKQISRMQGLEVHQLISHFVVVLERVHQ